MIGGTCIGIAPILVRLSETGPSATAGFRLLFALPILWLWAAKDGIGGSKLNRQFFVLAGLAGVAFAGDLAFWHWSLQFTTVANSTLFTNFAPFLVTIGAWWLLKEKITGALIGGLVLALAGGILLVSESLELSRKYLIGDLLGLVTAAFYAGYLLCVKELRKTQQTSWIMAISGVVSCPLLFAAAAGAKEQILPATAKGWSVLLALALISHIGGQCFITSALKHLPASFSSVALLWQPVVAAVLAAFFLGERLSSNSIIGGVIVLAGIALAALPAKQKTT